MAEKKNEKTKPETTPDTDPRADAKHEAGAKPKPVCFRSRHDRYIHRVHEFVKNKGGDGCALVTDDPAVIAELRASPSLGIDFVEVGGE